MRNESSHTPEEYQRLCAAAANARKHRSEKNATAKFICERFWEKVDKKSPDECWPWIAGKAYFGHGQFRIGRRKIAASRYAYILTNGNIPNSMFVCHRCDNPSCCNPKHLFLGTPKDNMQDCLKKGRYNSPKGEQHGMAKITPDIVEKIRSLYFKDGMTSVEIAPMFRISKTNVADIVSGRGWSHVPGKTGCRLIRGENHPESVLSAEDVGQIRKQYTSGKITMQSLADKFSVHTVTIFDVIHRKTWKHV